MAEYDRELLEDLKASINEEEDNLINQIKDWDDRVDEHNFIRKHGAEQGVSL